MTDHRGREHRAWLRKLARDQGRPRDYFVDQLRRPPSDEALASLVPALKQSVVALAEARCKSGGAADARALIRAFRTLQGELDRAGEGQRLGGRKGSQAKNDGRAALRREALDYASTLTVNTKQELARLVGARFGVPASTVRRWLWKDRNSRAG